MGVPLFDSSGQLLGNLCIIDNKHLVDEQRARSVLEIFAVRAAAEIERKLAENSLRESDEELQRALTEVERLKERLGDENVYLRRQVSEENSDGNSGSQSDWRWQVLQPAPQRR